MIVPTNEFGTAETVTKRRPKRWSSHSRYFDLRERDVPHELASVAAPVFMPRLDERTGVICSLGWFTGDPGEVIEVIW